MTEPAEIDPSVQHPVAVAEGLVADLAAGRTQPLIALTSDEWKAVAWAALFWYAGEGAMDGALYEALDTGLAKLFPTAEGGAAA